MKSTGSEWIENADPTLPYKPKCVFDMFDQEVLDVILETKDIQDIGYEYDN